METKERENTPGNCKKLRNSLFFIMASAATAALVYYSIKERRRAKMEKELLAYEVW